MSLKELDPNFIVYFENNESNRNHLINEFQTKDIPIIGSTDVSGKETFAYVRLDPTEDRLLDLFDITTNLNCIKKVVPIYDQKTQKLISHSIRRIMKNIFGIPNERELLMLTVLSGDPDLGLYLTYFAYYMKALLLAGIMGLCFRFYYGSQDSEFNLSYTVSIVLWSIGFTINWVYHLKPYYINKVYKTQKISIRDMTNKNKVRKENSHNSILLKKIVFVPIAIIFIIGLFFFQLSCFSLEIFVTQLYDGNYISLFSLLPPVLLSTITPILLTIYNLLFVDPCVMLENGPAPNSSKLEKNMPLLFLMNFSPLLITLFLYYPYSTFFAKKWTNEFRPQLMNDYTLPLKQIDFMADKNRHNAQIIYFTITNQALLLAMDNLLPMFLNKVKQFLSGSNKQTSKKNLIKSHIKRINPSELEYWEQHEFYKNNAWGNFDVDENMKKLIFQLGFVMFFSNIWPLTPLIYFVFNLVIFRTDFVRSLQKCTPSSIPNNTVAPHPMYMQHHSSLGSWDIILQIITWLGTIINPLISLLYYHKTHQVISTTNLGTRIKRCIRYLKTFVESKSNIPITIGIEQISLLLIFILYRVRSNRRSKSKVDNREISEINVTRKREMGIPINSSTVVSSRNNKWVNNESTDNDLTLVPQISPNRNKTDLNRLGETDESHIHKRNTTLPTNNQVHIERQRSTTITSNDESPIISDISQSIASNDTPVKHRNSIISMERFLTKLKPHQTPHGDVEHPLPEVYVSGKYHEMNENHFPQTLRNIDKQREHRSTSLSSSTHMPSVSPNSLAATAAQTALSGKRKHINQETRVPSSAKPLGKPKKYENILRNITNTEKQSSKILRQRSQKNDRPKKNHISKPETVTKHEVKILENDSKKKKDLFSRFRKKV